MATAEFPRAASPRVPADDGAGTTLHSNLQRLSSRRNALAMRNAIVRALIPAVAISALGVLAYRFYLVDGEAWMPIVLLIGALLIGYRNGRLAQRGAFAAAVDADRKLGLDDEIASALSFARPDAMRRAQTSPRGKDWLSRFKSLLFPQTQWHTASAPMATALVPALVADAAQRSTQINARALYPNTFDRSHKMLGALSVLLLGFALMPNNGYFLADEQKKLVKTLQAQGAELEQIAKKVQQKKDAPQAEKTRELARRLQALGRKMQRGRMTRKSALLGLGQLKKDMEKVPQSERSSPSSDTARLEEALRNGTFDSPAMQQAQRELKSDQREAAAKQLEKLAEKVENGELSKTEKEQAARDLNRAAQQLRKQGGAANEQAAQQLEEAAKSLQENQGGQQQQGKSGQGQQNQQGQQQQGQGGQKQNGQQGQQGQQQGKNGQQQNGQQQGQQGQQGQKGQQQNGQKGQQQGGQQGQQSGSQQGQQQGGQQGQQQSGSQQGQQSQGGQQGGQSGQQSGNQGAANALRGMANGVRGQSGGGQSVRDMMKKIEEAENQTGSNSGSQSGKGSQSGQSGGSGQSGQGQMVTPGKDLRPSDPTQGNGGGPGLGPRNNIKGGAGKGGGVSNLRARRTGDKRRWGDVWSDRLPKTRSKLDRITGKMGAQGEAEQLSTRTEARSGSVKTPYYDVYESYKKDAEDAISRESVPPAYKAPVKEYFDSLKP